MSLRYQSGTNSDTIRSQYIFSSGDSNIPTNLSGKKNLPDNNRSVNYVLHLQPCIVVIYWNERNMDVTSGSIVGQIGPRWDKSGTFSDQISIHFSLQVKNSAR